MKVGTDGVLLGAWTPLPDKEPVLPILEVGCGCGLVSLMLAQRLYMRGWGNRVVVRAIDIHPPSCMEAAENVERSPFAGLVAVEQADFLHLPSSYAEGSWELIVSNPPFFSHGLKSPDAGRNTARHNDTLPFGALVGEAGRLLADEGRLVLVLPPEAFREVTHCLRKDRWQWRPHCVTRVFSRPGKPCERVLCEWKKTQESVPVYENTLFIHHPDGSYDEAYRDLVQDFYLWA